MRNTNTKGSKNLKGLKNIKDPKNLKDTKKQKLAATSVSKESKFGISKGRLIGYGICLAILVVLMVIAVILVIKIQQNNQPQYWIDCQPPLSEIEATRCEKAKAANYPYIAY